MEEFGKKIKALRINAKMSADQLAEALGREGTNKKQYVYDLEGGRTKKLSYDIVVTLSKIFKVPTNHFYKEQVENELVNSKTNLPFDEKEIELGYREKYYKALEEISELKSKLIKLFEDRNGE